MGDNKDSIEEDIKKQVKVNILMMQAAEAYDVGDYEQAIKLLQDAVEILPENSSLWYELARSYRENGDFDKEIDSYKEIITLGEDDADAWLNMALAYRILGKAPEEMYCLIIAADKGADMSAEIGEESQKTLVINRYRELTMQKIQARNPLSNEDRVPVYEPSMADGSPEQSNCIVCYQKIDKEKEQGQILMCPHCKRLAHFVCLASWLQGNLKSQICPVCHGTLDFALENYDMKEALGIGKDDSLD